MHATLQPAMLLKIIFCTKRYRPVQSSPKGNRLFNSPNLYSLRFIIALTSIILMQSSHGQTVRDDVGYTALLNEMGADTPNAAGMSIGIIEPAFVGRDNPEIIGLWTKENISQEEKVVFAHHLLMTMRQREYEWQELQENAVDTDVFDIYAKILNAI